MVAATPTPSSTFRSACLWTTLTNRLKDPKTVTSERKEGKSLKILVEIANIFRLMQNRKSAKKCRLKKKAEYSSMQEEFEKVNQENNELKNQVSKRIQLTYAGEPNHDDALPKD